MGKTNIKTVTTPVFAPLLLAFLFFSCSRKDHLPHWIGGRWVTSLDNELIHENWTVHNGHLSGQNYMVYENRFQREKLRIFEHENLLCYQIVIDKDTLLFTCDNYIDADTLTFVNNQNSFPKRINYARGNGSQMSVWIGNAKNDPHGIFFTFKKVK